MQDQTLESGVAESGARWMAAMRCGDFEAAWRETDRLELPRRRAEAAGRIARDMQHLTWNGTPFDGRDVLVRCDHGLGDTLQFIRYVPLLCARARSACVLVQPTLLPILEGSLGSANVVDAWADEAPPRHDVEIEVMELAYAFRSTVDTLPREVPYLPLDAIRRRAALLPPISGDAALRVGLIWSASEWDTRRSIPLRALAPLRNVKGVRFYSLQQGEHAESVRNAPVAIEPYSRHTAEITAAAAAMLELDLIVTVDAMTAHLAGALARPVWVLLQHEADWRWMTARDDSPWYPTMRLFRQPRQGDWSSVAEAVVKALRVLAQRSG